MAEVAEKPKLIFVNAEDGSELVAHWNDTVQALENSFSVRESTSGLRCSFAGGCKYSIKAPGLTSSLQDDSESRIDICGNTCVVDPADSDET